MALEKEGQITNGSINQQILWHPSTSDETQITRSKAPKMPRYVCPSAIDQTQITKSVPEFHRCPDLFTDQEAAISLLITILHFAVPIVSRIIISPSGAQTHTNSRAQTIHSDMIHDIMYMAGLYVWMLTESKRQDFEPVRSFAPSGSVPG